MVRATRLAKVTPEQAFTRPYCKISVNEGKVHQIRTEDNDYTFVKDSVDENRRMFAAVDADDVSHLVQEFQIALPRHGGPGKTPLTTLDAVKKEADAMTCAGLCARVMYTDRKAYLIGPLPRTNLRKFASTLESPADKAALSQAVLADITAHRIALAKRGIVHGAISQERIVLHGAKWSLQDFAAGALRNAGEAGDTHGLGAAILGLACGVALRPDPNRTAVDVLLGAQSGDVAALHALDPGVAVVNALAPQSGYPLSLAAQNGHVDAVKFLLSRGAFVNAADLQGRTALLSACCNNQVKVAKILLEAGADPSIGDSRNFVPLLAAAQDGSNELITLLLSKGANIAHRSSNAGSNVLSLAACYGHVDTVRLLLKSGADKNMVANTGVTPLWLAIESSKANSEACALELIKAGADLNIRSAQHGTALQNAVKKGKPVVVQQLLKAGAEGGDAFGPDGALVAAVRNQQQVRQRAALLQQVLAFGLHP